MGRRSRTIGFAVIAAPGSQRQDALSPAVVLKWSDQHLPRLLQQDNTLPEYSGPWGRF